MRTSLAAFSEKYCLSNKRWRFCNVLLYLAAASVFSTKIAAITLNMPTLISTVEIMKRSAYGQPKRRTTSKNNGRPWRSEQSLATEQRKSVNQALAKEEKPSTPASCSVESPKVSCMSIAMMYNGTAIKAKLHANGRRPPTAPLTIIASSVKKVKRHTRTMRAIRTKRITRSMLNRELKRPNCNGNTNSTKNSRTAETTSTVSNNRHRNSVSLARAHVPRPPKKNLRHPNLRMLYANSAAKNAANSKSNTFQPSQSGDQSTLKPMVMAFKTTTVADNHSKRKFCKPPRYVSVMARWKGFSWTTLASERMLLTLARLPRRRVWLLRRFFTTSEDVGA
mmetsp:Transcript_46336/g.133456  ORF Transcript_46336/g.133456 Transcript_46336/m.133456 type:complete len:336 (-) Transcript_46336:383-1390(-)